jgi:hypothetical protein
LRFGCVVFDSPPISLPTARNRHVDAGYYQQKECPSNHEFHLAEIWLILAPLKRRFGA